MAHMSLKLSFVLSLIGLVLVLNAAQPTPRPSPRKLPIHPTESTFQHQRGGYAYYGPANAGVPAENQRKSQPTTSITKNAANTENGIKQPDWLTAFTGVLALVAFLQLLTLIAQSLASWRTYKATRSNAKATFRSALAAMRSARVAKLAIQADRPYLLVEKATLTGVVSKLKDQTGLFALLQGEKLNPPNAFFPQPVFTFSRMRKKGGGERIPAWRPDFRTAGHSNQC